MTRTMLISLFCALLVGCDYTIPLVQEAEMEIDDTVIGVWQRRGSEGEIEKLLVLPLSRYEYLVSFQAGANAAIFARASHWEGAAMTIVQLEWLGTDQARLPDDDRIFQYATYTIEDAALTIRLLNPKVVPNNITSADALAEAIANNRDKPGFFRDAMVLQKVKGD